MQNTQNLAPNLIQKFERSEYLKMKWLSAGIFLNFLYICKTLGDQPKNFTTITTSLGPGGNVNLDVKTFIYGPGVKVFNNQKIVGSDGLIRISELDQFLFGVSSSPYTSSKAQENNALSANPNYVDIMLRVVKTKFHSLMINSMGVPDSNYKGPWDKARMDSLSSTLAAQINRKNNSMLLRVLQGSRLFKNNKNQPDVVNAFKAAESANNIFPLTVWGVSINVDNEWGYIQNSEEMLQVYEAITHQGFQAKALGQELLIGTKMDICSEIVNGRDKNTLIQLATICNFIICYVNPPFGTEKPEVAVAKIGEAYQRYSEAFAKVNPKIDIAIATGWASEGDSDVNFSDANTPKAQAKFWNEMEKWALANHVRVYMHDAFDQPTVNHDHYKHLGLWQRSKDGSNKYFEKLTNKIVNV